MMFYSIEDYIGMIIAAVLIILIFLFIKNLFKRHLSRWGHLLDFIKYPTDEFYTKLQSKLKDRKLENVSYKVVNKKQGGILSKRRKYLRVRYKRYNTFICCMPVGRGTHITWWMRYNNSMAQSIIGAIPIIGQLINAALFPKTYYIYDSAEGFITHFQGAVTEMVDEALKENNIKALSENERAYMRNPKLRM